MAEKSKILIIGATGYFGKYLVEASVKAGHPTFALVRESSFSDPEKSKVMDGFKSLGVTLIHGDLYDQVSLVSAIKKVDMVISTVGDSVQQLSGQVNIIAAIKEAGNVKRFLPSEFSVDVDRHHAVEPFATDLRIRAKIRRSVEAEGIPYTFVTSSCFAHLLLPNLAQLGYFATPREKVVILGDGNAKATYVTEEDVAEYIIKAVDDPRTLNKILYTIPPANVLSFNELVALWESKIGKTLEKTYVHEEELLKNIHEEASMPSKLYLSMWHSIFLKGDTAANYDQIEASCGVEASDELYPELKYTT